MLYQISDVMIVQYHDISVAYTIHKEEISAAYRVVLCVHGDLNGWTAARYIRTDLH